MPSLLDQNLTLVLNAHWQIIGTRSVRQALVALCSESAGEPPAYALDMEMDEDGNLIYANPVPWDVWVTLPVRASDLFIQSARQKVRVPTIIIARNYSKVPMKRLRWSNGNVHERDGYVCAYTNQRLSRSEATVDHVIPKSRGGRDVWENTVSCHRKINTLKGNRTPEEAGLKLLRKPAAPPALPVSATITEARHPDWLPFLIRSSN